jgi:hypothetical protein
MPFTSHVEDGVSAVQSTHVVPPLPHRTSAKPGWHAPVESQQPLQFCEQGAMFVLGEVQLAVCVEQ